MKNVVTRIIFKIFKKQRNKNKINNYKKHRNLSDLTLKKFNIKKVDYNTTLLPKVLIQQGKKKT